MRELTAALTVALVFTFGVASARAQETTPPPAPAATADEARLRRIEAELERTRAELDAIKRERAAAPAPTAAPAATSTAAPLAATAAPSTASGTATHAGAGNLVPDPPDEEPLSSQGVFGQVEVKAGLGKGFTIGTLDDSFSLNIRARIQIRFTQGIVDGGDDDGLEDSYQGFQVRRARLVFQGHAFTRDVTYYIQLGFSNLDTERDVESVVRDAWLNWAILRDVQLRMGQQKVFFNRQRMISSSALQFPDRSIVQNELTLDRDVGIVVHSPDLGGMDGLLSYALGVYGGDGRNRVASGPGLLVGARFQVAPFGKFDDLVEADLDRSEKPRLAIAAAAAYNEDSHRTRSTHGGTYQGSPRDTTDFSHLEADLHFKWSGLSILSEVLYRDASDPAVIRTTPTVLVEPTRSGWGWFFQSGYMLTEKLEVAARHGELYPLGGLTAIQVSRETGVASSYYFHRHDLKVQADYFYLWNDRLAGGVHEIRVQLQLFF